MSNRKIGFTVFVVAAISAVSATCYVAAARATALETTAPAAASGRWQSLSCHDGNEHRQG